MKLSRWILPALISASLYAGFGRGIAFAQLVPGSDWSEPINLSESLTSSSSPVIVADQYGFVHTFWSEDLGGEPHDGLSAPQTGNTIMHRGLYGDSWTEPTDIFYGGRNSRLGSPAAVVDKNGNLHLVWVQDNLLRYSYAPAWQASLVRAWAEPVSVVEGPIGQVRLVYVGDKIIAIYGLVSGEQAGIYAASVSPQADIIPHLIWQSPERNFPYHIGAAVDGKGRLQITWSVRQPPQTGAMEVWYASSEDGLLYWSENRLVAQQTSAEDSLQFADPWVASRGEDEIHLQWAQGAGAFRLHQYSTDGGKSWSQSYQIWPDLLSQTHSQAAGEDQDGNLYWVDVLRFPNGIYCMRWTGSEWQRPEFFYAIGQEENENPHRINVHAIRMAINLGKELHIVFVDQDRAEVWHMHRSLPASGFVAQPTPWSTPVPELISTATLISIIKPAQSANQPVTEPSDLPANDLPVNSDGLRDNPGLIVIAVVLPVMLIAAMVAMKSVKMRK